MKRFSHFLALIVLSVGLFGCKLDFSTTIYSTDAFSTDDLTTPARLTFGVGSCDSDRRSALEASILSTFAIGSEARVIGCDDGDITVSFDALLTDSSEAHPNYDITFNRTRWDDTFDIEGQLYEAVTISALMSDQFVTNLKQLARENYTSISYDETKIFVDLHNDHRGSIAHTTHYTWIDGVPVEMNRRTLMKRRNTVNFRFTNLTSERLWFGYPTFVMHLYQPIDQ